MWDGRKSSENDQLTGHIQSFFDWSFSEGFFSELFFSFF